VTFTGKSHCLLQARLQMHTGDAVKGKHTYLMLWDELATRRHGQAARRPWHAFVHVIFTSMSHYLLQARLHAVNREAYIPDALRRARVSRARPSSTKASSMTGSSRKPTSRPAPGSSRLAVPAVKDVAAPRPIKLFMLGLPLQEGGTQFVWIIRIISNKQ